MYVKPKIIHNYFHGLKNLKVTNKSGFPNFTNHLLFFFFKHGLKNKIN